MAAADNDVTTDLLRHPRGWLMVRLHLPVVDRVLLDLDVMLNTGRPQSALSLRMHRTLIALGHVTAPTGSHFAIRNARLGDTALPNIPMRLSAGPALLGLEGMLGLDFLVLFAEARLDVRAPRLTLVRP